MRISKITNVRITKATDLWPNSERCVGKFVAQGNIALGDDRGFVSGDPIRTSLLVSIDIEKGIITTLNTEYHIV